MLPFAEGVTCDAAKMQGIICDQSRSVLYRIILVLFIVTIVGAISWLGYKFRQSSPKFSALLLSCFPLVILIWLVGCGLKCLALTSQFTGTLSRWLASLCKR